MLLLNDDYYLYKAATGFAKIKRLVEVKQGKYRVPAQITLLMSSPPLGIEEIRVEENITVYQADYELEFLRSVSFSE
jgi:hypothetical protein